MIEKREPATDPNGEFGPYNYMMHVTTLNKQSFPCRYTQIEYNRFFIRQEKTKKITLFSLGEEKRRAGLAMVIRVHFDWWFGYHMKKQSCAGSSDAARGKIFNKVEQQGQLSQLLRWYLVWQLDIYVVLPLLLIFTNFVTSQCMWDPFRFRSFVNKSKCVFMHSLSRLYKCPACIRS